jgi:hypothetical protein
MTPFTDPNLEDQLRSAQESNMLLEQLHEDALNNVVSVYTGNEENTVAAANMLRQIIAGYNAPAMFNESGLNHVRDFMQDPARYSMSLQYVHQIFKHDRNAMLSRISHMISDAWTNGYTKQDLTPAVCRKMIETETPLLMIFMCMLYPNATIGVATNLQARNK